MNDNSILAKYRKWLINAEKQIEKARELGHNTTKLKNRIRYYKKAIGNLERNNDVINKLQPRTYYSIKISHSSSNTIHSAIMYVEWDIESGVTIFNPTYDPMAETYAIEDIYYLEPLRELEEMKDLF